MSRAGQGKILSWDKASFWVQTNLSKLPCVEKIETSEGLLKGEEIQTEYPEISNEELLSGHYDPYGGVDLKERGIKEKPKYSPSFHDLYEKLGITYTDEEIKAWRKEIEEKQKEAAEEIQRVQKEMKSVT